MTLKKTPLELKLEAMKKAAAKRWLISLSLGISVPTRRLVRVQSRHLITFRICIFSSRSQKRKTRQKDEFAKKAAQNRMDAEIYDGANSLFLSSNGYKMVNDRIIFQNRQQPLRKRPSKLSCILHVIIYIIRPSMIQFH